MFSLKPAALGAAFIGTATTMAFTATSAQALSISGEIGGFGFQSTDGTDEIVMTFGPAMVVGSEDLDFVSGNASVASITLTDQLAPAGGLYDYEATDDFITFLGTFGLTPVATFDLNAGAAEVSFTGTEIEVDFSPITGDLFGESGTYLLSLTGSLSSSDSGAIGTYQFTLETAPVPEPLTILGAGTAIAFGGAFKRKLGKQDKKESTKA